VDCSSQQTEQRPAAGDSYKQQQDYRQSAWDYYRQQQVQISSAGGCTEHEKRPLDVDCLQQEGSSSVGSSHKLMQKIPDKNSSWKSNEQISFYAGDFFIRQKEHISSIRDRSRKLVQEPSAKKCSWRKQGPSPERCYLQERNPSVLELDRHPQWLKMSAVKVDMQQKQQARSTLGDCILELAEQKPSPGHSFRQHQMKAVMNISYILF
jgi:hypothetical protein